MRSRGPGRDFYIYWGNPKAEAPKDKDVLDIRRGVLLEMWEFAGGPVRTVEQVQEAVAKARAKGLLGADFRDRIFQAFNPFGPEDHVAALYSGWLMCPSDGNYVFATSSQGGSFLLLDDKVVVENGGTHGPQNNVAIHGETRLTGGLHKITMIQASGGGDPVAVAAWRPPGEKDIVPIPAGAFAPTWRADPQPMEQAGKSAGIDFIPVHAGKTFMDNRYYQRYSFAATPVGSLTKAQLKWDFGDGQTSAEAAVDHVYLKPGEYQVTLTATGAGGAAGGRPSAPTAFLFPACGTR